MTILKDAVAAVMKRRADYEEAEAYYEGDVPETFATVKLRKALRATGERSRLNFCRPIVDVVNDRLEIANIAGETKKATDAIATAWLNNELALEAQEIHRRALTFGDCYALVWPGEDGALEIAYNSPLTTTIVYDVENPRKKAYAVKMWQSGENSHRMNMYFADRIVKYSADTGSITEGTDWATIGEDNNPFGEVPVFHFRTHRPFGRPEHIDCYDAQNFINKSFINHIYTMDYQGAPQRYALANFGNESEMADFGDGDTDRENIGALRSGPGEVWYMKGVSMVGEFKPADAASFWTPIQNTIESMAIMSKTPMHYMEKAINIPSGNALRSAEAPLLKKVEDRKASFGATWRELFRFILKVDGIVSDVQVFWKAVESLDELERWDVTLKKINAGLSHQQALREGGYSEDQIKKIMAERDQEAQNGQYYQRKPEVRVNNSHDETNALDASQTQEAKATKEGKAA